jgi:hypothetical protein
MLIPTQNVDPICPIEFRPSFCHVGRGAGIDFLLRPELPASWLIYMQVLFLPLMAEDAHTQITIEHVGNQP